VTQHLRQPRPLASEPSQRVLDSPYLLAEEAAVYLRFKNVRSLYSALREGVDIPVRRRGRTLLFHRDDLDRWLAGERRVALLKDARRRA